MTTATARPLSTFTDWIRQTDQFAAHHLSLLDRAAALGGPADEETRDVRRALAEKLDSWRYQLLNERGDLATAQEESLLDALDLAANQLAGRADRSARQTRHAIRDPAADTPGMQEAMDWLRADRPVAEFAARAARVTREHFRGAPGASSPKPRMLLYAPLYVSSYCVNHCTYCGFRYPLSIARRHLDIPQVVQQMRILKQHGFGHLLVVGGDFPSQTTTGFFARIAETLVAHGVEPAIEIAPQSTGSYAELIGAGVCGLTLYQETYDQEQYRACHVRGPKSSYHWRLEAHDRAAEAGMPRLGLGFLLGLADPLEDLLAMMRHGSYLSRRFPDRTIAFSLPRIHEAPDGFRIPHEITDSQLIRMYAALRMAFPRAELVLSTREPAALRDQLADICITQMSAGSCTTPGGYEEAANIGGQQFPVSDQRSPADVARRLQEQGHHVCWSLAETRPPALVHPHPDL